MYLKALWYLQIITLYLELFLPPIRQTTGIPFAKILDNPFFYCQWASKGIMTYII